MQARPFAFINDPSTPSKGTTSVSYALGIGSGIAADRPLPANIASSGLSNGVTVSHGLTDRLAPFLSATLGENSATHVRAGASFQLWNPRAPLRIAITGAVLREGTTGAAGGAVGVAASLDQGPFRFAATTTTATTAPCTRPAAVASAAPGRRSSMTRATTSTSRSCSAAESTRPTYRFRKTPPGAIRSTHTASSR